MDPVTAIGLASSIISFVDLGVKVIARLKVYNEKAASTPALYKDLADNVQLLIEIVETIREQGEKRKVNASEATLRALVPIVQGCKSQIELLNDLFDKITPTQKDSLWKRQLKALRSVRIESDVQAIYSKICRYQGTLTLYQVSYSKLTSVFSSSNTQTFCEIPDSRVVPYFVGRKDILADLEYMFDNYSHQDNGSNTPTVILLGMGGQGKTQIALQFCRKAYRADKYGNRRFHAIFWVDASTETTVRKGFQSIYKTISGEQQTSLDENDQIQFVKNTMKKWRFSWLIVFDNYDEPPAFRNLEDFIPSGPHGSILITSRHEDAGQRGQVVNVPGLAEEDAVDLLISQSRTEETENALKEVRQIVQRLGYLALAIHQAGAYIFKHPPLSSFLDSFEAEKNKLLTFTPTFWQYKRVFGNNEQERFLSAFTTWELSLGNLDADTDRRDKIVEFITISAYLYTRNISEDLIKPSFSDAGSWMNIFLGPAGQWDGNKFLNILIKLRELALIQSFSPEKRCFSLHPVVSDWLKCRTLEKDLVRTQRSHRFAATKLVKNCLTATVKDLPLSYQDLSHDVRQNMLLHATSCVGNANDFANLDSVSSEWEEISQCLAEFYDSVGDYKSAQILQEGVVRRRERNPDNTLLLSSQGLLAEIYHHQGSFKEAESILRKAADLLKEALQRADPVAFRLADILVRNLAWQEKYEEAEKQVRLVIQAKEKTYKIDDRSLLKSRSMLAWILENSSDNDKLKEAEKLNDDVLKRREEYFGETDLDTLTSYNAQGVLYHMTGRLLAGEQFIRKAVQGREARLGRTHPDTLNVLTNLSMILASQRNKIADAEKLAREVLRSRRERLGESHISTLVSVVNLIRILTKKDPSGQLHTLEIDGLKDRLKTAEKSGQVVSPNLESDLNTLKLDADAQIVPARGMRGLGLGGRGLGLSRIAGKHKKPDTQPPMPSPLPPAPSDYQQHIRNLQSQLQVQQ